MNSIKNKRNQRAALILATALASVSGLALAAGGDSGSQTEASAKHRAGPGGHHAGHGKHCGKSRGERGHHGHRGGHHGQRGGHGEFGMKMMLKGLDLTEAQRDQVFEIRHAAMPAMRDASKQMRQARKSLRELALQGKVSPEQIAQSSAALEKAVGELATVRAQSMSAVVDVLTDEQATKLRERMNRRGKRGERGERGGKRS
ncbi:MAG: Spy/CpxP family protein refolding chaperone [Burkholderiaceae bacterium]